METDHEKHVAGLSLPHDVLPPEIWLRIFHQLPPQDLRASTLACSTFQRLAQPFLFTVFDVSPFFLAYNTDRYILRPRKYLDRTIERLQFYLSSHIAPAVKHCWISPYSRSGFPPRNHRDYLEPRLIIDAVIAALPSFPNLAKLSWHCTNITAEWWGVISKLPIKSLWLNSCTVDGAHPPPLPVQRLDLDEWAWEGEVTNHVSIHEEDAPGVSRATLPLVLHPDHIQYISVPREDTGHRLLSTISEMDTLRCLRAMRIPFAAMSSPCFIRTLVQCPSLEELRIFTPSNEQAREITLDSLPLSSLPLLSVYDGPYTNLLTFATGRILKNVILWGLDESPGLCDPLPLLNMLRRFEGLNQALQYLQISVHRVTVDLLTILSSFPLLETVVIESADNPSRASAPVTSALQISYKSPVAVLYILLRTVTLPPRLKRLRIITKLSSGNLDTPTQELEVSRVVENLAQSHPALHAVEISYGTYWSGVYSACWNRLLSSGGGDRVLGKLTFSEHRRTIVFPDTHRLESGWNQDGDTQGRFSIFMWLQRFFYKYI